MNSRATVAFAAMSCVLLACSGDTAVAPCPPVSSRVAAFSVAAARATPFDPLFDAAARRFGVDAGLLRAIAWTETRLQDVVPEHADEPLDHHGQPAAWGVMALRGERLERAARLAGLDPVEVRTSPAANIAAAAALLAAEARATGVEAQPPGRWAEALAHFSGIDAAAGRAAYAEAVLAAVFGAQPVAAAATRGDPCTDPTPPVGPPPGRYVWRASPNFNQRASGVAGQIAMIIIHTCEGGYIGCWSWLTNSASQVSAHYVVNEEGTEISHLVQEAARAWHIGATYDCSLNRSRRCDLQGVQSNHFTVGIEHAGFAAQTSFPTQQIDVSAQLTCEISRRHDIPRDFQHIVAHGQLQPWNRTDPGRNWPWVRYVTLAQRHCGELVVDDDAAFNEPGFARATASAAWTAASASPGHYGGGYRFAPTSATSDDPLVFEFLLERAGERTVEARWTAGSNRTAAARFAVRNGDVVAATAVIDQRSGSDQWHPIARLNLPAGWHRVELSRRGEEGSVVVADAIRVR